MFLNSRPRYALSALIGGSLLAGLLAPNIWAQRNRLNGPIRSPERVILRGHTAPDVKPANDVGPANPSLVLENMSLVLRPSAAQQADLDQLLREQQDPASPNYHHWLSPEEYAARFGTSAEDIARITDWLKQQRLDVKGVARARNTIQFSGTAGAVGAAFRTQIRHYQVNGKRHFANSTDPSIPADLDLLVTAIVGLDDFRLEPKGIRGNAEALPPDYTSSSGHHYLAPDDIATIYDVQPLYASGFDGTGQTIVIAGQTQMDLSDVRAFRAHFGLPANDPVTMLVPGLADPGVSSSDVPEANLDLQWAGAIARNARILYVYSSNVMDAVQYAIDQNLAPVVSVSYGLCEQQTSAASLNAVQTWARQGNAQGITWVNAAGDSGGADCVSGNSSLSGLAVDAPASVPEVTGVGGTTLTEGVGTYWNAANGPSDASVLAYVPETVWNDSTSGSPAAGGGGASIFFPKPTWQTGFGVPNISTRGVPDLALAASPNHDGYLVYNSGSISVFGGTSAGTPMFAAMIALLNQYLARSGNSGGAGNVNPQLYSLAQTLPSSFHDVTAGSNAITVTCTTHSRNCTSGTYGYSAGPGYDLASGLGSVDLYNLVTGWRGLTGSAAPATTNMTLASNVASISPTDSAVLTATLTASTGGVPQGSVTFQLGSVVLGASSLVGATGHSSASLTVSGTSLVGGPNTISATYSGNASDAGANASTIVTVTQPTNPVISALTSSASYQEVYAPGMLMSVFGSRLAPTIVGANTLPLPSQMAGVSVTVNGLTAPLLYVSPSQLNVQIPYEVPIGVPLAVIVNNNGNTVTGSVTATATAPGIFIDTKFSPIPNASASSGQIVTLFFTGAGAITPGVATGNGPDPSTPVAGLPRPQQTTSVTVGGVSAPLQFVGMPWGSAGVVQVNYQIPGGVPLGTNAVIVQVGNASSAAANLTIIP